jgi:hypothetical protein
VVAQVLESFFYEHDEVTLRVERCGFRRIRFRSVASLRVAGFA